MATSYKPSGNYDPAGVWGIPIGMAMVVVPVGTFYNWVTFGPSIHSPLHNAALMLSGIVYMMAAGGLSFIFKMRNPGQAVTSAVLGTAFGWFCVWLILPYMAAPDKTFFSFIADRLEEGVRVYPRRHRHSYQAQGAWLMLGWIIEALTVTYFAALGAKMQANMPFSERRGVWMRLRLQKPTITVYPPLNYKSVIKGLSEGDMRYLKGLSLKKPPRLSLFRRVPSVTITVMTDRLTPGGFLSLGFDDGKDRSSLLTNAYINDQAIGVIYRHFGRKW